MNKRWIVSRLVCLSLVLGMSAQAWAREGIDTPDPNLPPTSGKYMVDLSIFHSIYGPAILQNAAHAGFVNIVRTPMGPDELEMFDSTVMGEGSGGGGPLIAVSLMGPVEVLVRGKTGMTTGTFD